MISYGWFQTWADKHVERYPRADWPPFGTEFWDTLRNWFKAKEVTEMEAEEASKVLFEDPPPFIDQLPKALMEAVRSLRKAWAPKPNTSTVSNSLTDAAWNRAADAHWREITEQDRADALAMVRERMPFAADRPKFVESLAVAWAFEPALAVGPLPPPREPSQWPKPKTLFPGAILVEPMDPHHDHQSH